MSRCFLTGSKGFIGTYLRQHLEANGDTILGTSDEPLDGLYETPPIPYQTDVVYHLGALVRPQESMTWRRGYLDANVTGTVKVLEAVRLQAPNAKVVLFGSGTQDHLDSWYGYTKQMCELAGEAYAKFDSIPVYKLRLFGVTGAGKTGDVINDFAEQAVRDGRIQHGRLDYARDISDVRDVVPAIVDLVTRHPAGSYYIGRGEATSIEYIAKWFGVPLSQDQRRVRNEAPTHVSPAHSVKGRPIDETLVWVRESYVVK